MPPAPSLDAMSGLLRVGVVGGGAAGVLAAIHLLRAAPGGIEVLLYEPGRTFGLGVAYATQDPGHLLNVPAGRMSAFASDPEDFCRWAGLDGDDFAPRATFGRYLQHRFEEAVLAAPVAPRRVRARVSRIDRPGNGWAITSSSDSGNGPGIGRDEVDAVVLALGIGPPRIPAGLTAVASHPRCVVDPWAPAALDGIGAGDRVALVGTGLTAVDVALAAAERGATRIVGMSRHGLLPATHGPLEDVPVPPSGSPREFLSWLRANRDGWRGAVNSMRPVTARIWGQFTDAQKRQFLRLANRYWDVHRHRMAPEIGARVDAMRRDGVLQIMRARAVRAEAVGPERLRIAAHGDPVELDWVVLCTGPDDATVLGSELIAGLVAAGHAREGFAGMGIEVEPGTGRVRAADGSFHDGLVALGALRRGSEWESIAIPEIRVQAETVARLLTGA